jgi:hypothetical protein
MDDINPTYRAILFAMDYFFTEHDGLNTWELLKGDISDLPNDVTPCELFEGEWPCNFEGLIRDLAIEFDKFARS